MCYENQAAFDLFGLLLFDFMPLGCYCAASFSDDFFELCGSVTGGQRAHLNTQKGTEKYGHHDRNI